jgi:hypothetical protein
MLSLPGAATAPGRPTPPPETLPMALQEKLYEFCLLDKQVRGMRLRLESTTSRHAAQKAALDQLQRQREELTQQHKQAQAKAASQEHQARDMEQHINELRERMNSVTNNKEYSALLVEVNTLKAEMSKIEDEAIEHLNQVEMLDQEINELEEKQAERQKLLDVAASEVAAAQEEIGKQLDELTVRRDAAAGELPPETMTTFNRMADHTDGEALAVVIEEDRRHMAYTCGGCYMNLPFEHVNTLLARPDVMVCCTSCGRILYMDQALKTSMSPK